MELLDLIKKASLQKVNEKAIDFTLENIDGTKTTLSTFKGKVVVINFWAEWCGPCKSEMPSLQRLSDNYKGKDFVLLGINVSDPVSEAKKYAEKANLTFPIVCDVDSSVAASYGAQSIPLTYIIDKTGTVVAGGVGARPWDKPAIYEVIDALLA
jgi:peroxiredoxin